MKRLLWVIPVLLLFAGCQANRPLYYWGSYESTAYLGYAKPEKATLQVQLERLEEDVAKASASTAAAHPGLHAQLGYVYYQLGRVEDALKEFETEKRLFPESAAFMDRMMGKAQGAPAK